MHTGNSDTGRGISEEMKISFFYDHVLEAAAQSGKTTGEVMALCRQAGITGIEINGQYLQENQDRIRRELEENKMQISCIYQQYEFGQNTDLTAARETVLLAEKFHSQRVLAIPGFLTEQDAHDLVSRADTFAHTEQYMDAHPEIQRTKETLTQMCSFAAEHQVSVVLEDYDNFTAPFARTWQLLWFMKNVPGLRYALDIGNFAYSDEDVLAAYRVLQPYIVHVHCKDRGRERARENGRYRKGLAAVPFGYGYLPTAKVLELLKEQQYDGFYAIEHFGAPDQLKYMKKSAEYLQSGKKFRLFPAAF